MYPHKSVQEIRDDVGKIFFTLFHRSSDEKRGYFGG